MDQRGEEVHRTPVKTNVILEGVRYEIRGELAARAAELERQGYEVISLNIGNPGLFGYRTRGIVLINPNNPTGAVYSRELLEEIARIAEEKQIVVFSDEIYEQMLYGDAEHIPLATLVHETLCATFNGLSKIYRACGYLAVQGI